MGTESIEASFLSLFALICFFIFMFVSKYSYKIKGGALLDKDFSKPQAFHDIPVSRSGGIATIICLSIFFYIYYLLYDEVLYNYIFISYSVFIVGFLDDLRVKINPLKRLILMVLFLFLAIHFVPIKIFHINLLNYRLSVDEFTAFFQKILDHLTSIFFVLNITLNTLARAY